MIPTINPVVREDGMICDSYPGDGEPYRYYLVRTWDVGLPVAHVSGLNPSTAGLLIDDPTIRHTTAMLRWLGYGTYIMTNQFGGRSTDPKRLLTMTAPVGPENDKWIIEAVNCSAIDIFAYGSFPKLDWRFKQVQKLLEDVDLHCFAVNKDGSPKHPLYVKTETQPILWRVGSGN